MGFAAAAAGVLRSRGFLRLLSTRLLSQGADGVLQVALASAVLFSPEHQTDAAHLAASFVVVLLPYSVVGPFAGVFLDRWRRQRVLVWANAVRAVLVCGVAAILGYGGSQSVPFYLTALAAISVNRFYLAALSAALPHVVDEPKLIVGNSVSTTAGSLATILGGGVAVGLRMVVGSGDSGDTVVAVLAAVVYVGSALTAAGFGVDALGPPTGVGRAPLRAELSVVASGLAAGARHVWERERARNALAAIAAHRVFYGVSTLSMLLLYRNYFTDHGIWRAGMSGLAEIFAAGAVGVCAAAFFTPLATRRLHKETWVSVLFLLAALVEVSLGTPYRQDTFVVAAGLLGFVAQGSKICVDTTVQETVDDAFLGRVFSFYDVLFNLTFIAAAVASAMALPATGKSYNAIAVITLGYLVTGLAYRALDQRRRFGMAPGDLAAELTPAGN